MFAPLDLLYRAGRISILQADSAFMQNQQSCFTGNKTPLDDEMLHRKCVPIGASWLAIRHARFLEEGSRN